MYISFFSLKVKRQKSFVESKMTFCFSYWKQGHLPSLWNAFGLISVTIMGVP